MKDSTRQRLQIDLPLFAAAFFAYQFLKDYRGTGELSVQYIIGVVIFLAWFVLFSILGRSRK